MSQMKVSIEAGKAQVNEAREKIKANDEAIKAYESSKGDVKEKDDDKVNSRDKVTSEASEDEKLGPYAHLRSQTHTDLAEARGPIPIKP